MYSWQIAEQKSIEEKIQKLVGYTIPDIIALREHWVNQKKQNRQLDESTKKRRLEATHWVEAIDSILNSGLVSKKKEIKEIPDKSLVEKYTEALVQLKISTPKLDDLERVSGIKSPTWHRHLTDPIFVSFLIKAIRKKMNNAKTPDKIKFWKHAMDGLDRTISKIQSRHKSTNTEKFNPVAPPSVPDDIDSDVGDSMLDDIGRMGDGKTRVHNTD